VFSGLDGGHTAVAMAAAAVRIAAEGPGHGLIARCGANVSGDVPSCPETPRTAADWPIYKAAKYVSVPFEFVAR
jgi:hypothetical protein